MTDNKLKKKTTIGEKLRLLEGKIENLENKIDSDAKNNKIIIDNMTREIFYLFYILKLCIKIFQHNFKENKSRDSLIIILISIIINLKELEDKKEEKINSIKEENLIDLNLL